RPQRSAAHGWPACQRATLHQARAGARPRAYASRRRQRPYPSRMRVRGCYAVAMLRHASALLLGLGVLLGATCARAQLHRATDPVATPASSLVLKDDALALDVNPAALALQPSWSVALLHSEVDERGSWLGRGDALYAAGHIIGPLAIGATVQSIRPH